MIVRVDYVATAITPLHHGGNEKTGNLAMLRRLPFWVDGEIIEIPYIDGNAVRGWLRRLVARDFIQRIGYEPRTDILYHLLMSGGALEEAASRSGKVTVEFNRRVRALLPMVSLFGTSYLNQALTGRMCVGHLLPYCAELVRGRFIRQLPGLEPKSIYELLPWTHNTRRDDREVESLNTQQMIFEYEVFLPGSRLLGDFVLRDPTPLEGSTFAHLFLLWAEFPTIGARQAQGHGRLLVEPVQPLPFSPDAYLEHLNQHQQEIIALLEELDAIRAATHKGSPADAVPDELPLDS